MVGGLRRKDEYQGKNNPINKSIVFTLCMVLYDTTQYDHCSALDQLSKALIHSMASKHYYLKDTFDFKYHTFSASFQLKNALQNKNTLNFRFRNEDSIQMGTCNVLPIQHLLFFHNSLFIIIIILLVLFHRET